MGKKKTAEAAEQIITQKELDVALEGVIETKKRDTGTEDPYSDMMAETTVVIPFPGLVLEWLFGCNGWPLSRTAFLVAENHVGKTAFLAEIMRWHRVCGGKGYNANCEGLKDAKVLRASILNWDQKACINKTCRHLEEWQQFILKGAQMVWDSMVANNLFAPICYGCDSIVGVLCKTKTDSILKKGFAEAGFATEAKLAGEWIRVACSNTFLDKPFSFVATNHAHKDKDMHGKDRLLVPGGLKLLHSASINILMKSIGNLNQVNLSGRHVGFRLFKNTGSGTANSRRIDCYLLWKIVNGVQQTWWDWDDATIRFLADREIPGHAAKGEIGSKIMAACDIHAATAGRFWSKRLGVPKSDPMDPTELGKILHFNQRVMDDLRTALDIHRFALFSSNVRYIYENKTSGPASPSPSTLPVEAVPDVTEEGIADD